jgi:hypothetical protein
MILYVCMAGTDFGSLPAAIAHPCGRAHKALQDAGQDHEVRNVGGGKMLPWTWRTRARDRAEVERLSGQRSVPILVLDDGEVVTGSGSIVRWAHEHAAAAA